MRKINNKAQGELLGFLVIAVLVIAGIFAITSVRIVGAGEVGVHDVFGKVKGIFQPGLTLKHPLGSIQTYSTRIQTVKENMYVPSSEGLEVPLDASIVYRVNGNMAKWLYLNVEDIDEYILTYFRSNVRDVTATYEAKALYTDARIVVSQNISIMLNEHFRDKGVIIEDVKLRDVELPTKIANAIQTKLEAEQEAQAMEFVLQKETQEKQRRIIEAEGIASANEIIAESLSTNYLTWYWIENLESHESVLYVPVGQGGVPLFKELQ